MLVFAVPFMAQAADIGVSSPLYQADKLSHVIDVGQNKIVAAADNVSTANHNSKLKSFNLCTEMTEPKESVIKSGQCAACYSAATSITGVSGGGSIGIRPID